jgi:hypothetical protein
VGKYAEAQLVVLDDGGHPWQQQQRQAHRQQHQQHRSPQQAGSPDGAPNISSNSNSSDTSNEVLRAVADLSLKVLPAVMCLLHTVCWATSAQHGQITAQHGYMQSLSRGHAARTQPGCGPVTDLLSLLLDKVPCVQIFSRVSSNPLQQGDVQGMAGGLQGPADMLTDSLARQHGFCAVVVG